MKAKIKTHLANLKQGDKNTWMVVSWIFFLLVIVALFCIYFAVSESAFRVIQPLWMPFALWTIPPGLIFLDYLDDRRKRKRFARRNQW